MKIKQTVKSIFLGALLVFTLLAVMAPLSASAAKNKGCEADTAIIECKNVNTDLEGVQNSGVWSLLLTAINILTAGVGIAAIGGIIYGAILYTSAGGSPEQVKKAMGIITNVVIGVVAYAMMFAGLNFLIPGGIFN